MTGPCYQEESRSGGHSGAAVLLTPRPALPYLRVVHGEVVACLPPTCNVRSPLPNFIAHTANAAHRPHLQPAICGLWLDLQPQSNHG